MSDLSDNEIKALIRNLQENLATATEGPKSLESELESAAKHLPAYIKIVKSHKHLPAYIKIVKSHIDQLRTVLELENHNHRTLENAGLAAPVQQLIKLFNALHDSDIQMLGRSSTCST